MVAWSMGRIDGSNARKALETALPEIGDLVREEIEAVLER